jgi:hypothetical protein
MKWSDGPDAMSTQLRQWARWFWAALCPGRRVRQERFAEHLRRGHTFGASLWRNRPEATDIITLGPQGQAAVPEALRPEVRR